MNRATSTVSTLLKKLRQYYLHVLSLAALLLLVFVVYGKDLSMLVNEALENESLNHVLLVPFLAGFLFYLRKDTVRAALKIERDRSTSSRYVDGIMGMILCLIAFLTYWYGSYTFYPVELHLLSLPIFIAGTIAILLNLRALRMLIIPVLFLVFLVPIPAEIVYQTGSAMGSFNTMVSYQALKAFSVPVVLSSSHGPPILMLTNTSSGAPASFTVDLSCSGVYSVIAFAMLGTFLFFITEGPLVKKAAMIAVGFAVFETLNVLRIISVVSIAYGLSVEAAMTIFHSAAGLILIFTGIILTLFTAERALKVQVLPKAPDTSPCPECTPSLENYESFCAYCGRLLKPIRERIHQRFWGKLMLLLLCSTVVSMSINAPTLALAEKSIETTANFGPQNATTIFPQIPDYNLAFLGRDTGYERVAKQYASLMYAYYPTANSSAPIIYTYVNVAGTISNLHNWEVCLIGWQTIQGREPLVRTLESKDLQLLSDLPIIARYLVFHDTRYNYTQSTLYWFERATFNTGTTIEQKYVRISLIIITQNITAFQQFENPLLTLGQAIATYWESLTNESLISLGIPAQQLLLASSMIFLVAAKSAQYSNERRKRNINLRLFSNLASTKERTALTTLLKLSKERRNIETRDVRNAITQKTGKQVNLSTLLKILRKLEEHDFVRREIATVDRRPTAVWKTQIPPPYNS